MVEGKRVAVAVSAMLIREISLNVLRVMGESEAVNARTVAGRVLVLKVTA